MNRLFLLFVLAPAFFAIYPQTLVSSYNFPRFTPYDYFWGITEVNDTFWIGTDYSTTSGVYTYNKIYKVTKTGAILDSLSVPFKSHHGLAWDGMNFWIAEGYRALGSRIYKMNTQGVLIDSFFTAQVIGGIPIGIGDVWLDGNKLWFTVFSPDFTSYPNSYAYAFDINTKLLVDTLPLYGRQPLGIAMKGDTVFYVNENQYTTETERIWAINKNTGDTLFTFPAPDPDGTCNPKGLHWDGHHLWLVAERIGTSSWIYKTIYKYEITGQGSPVITTSSNFIDFGNTLINSTAAQNISITNPGSAPLIISGIEFSSPEFKFSQLRFPDTIAVNNSKQYSVTFTPVQYGDVNSTLKIFSNDGGTPVKNITLHGKGVYSGSYITTPGQIYSFGPRRYGSLNGWVFTIENRGNEPLVISSVNLSNPAFKYDSLSGAFPVVVDTQKSRALRVWFQPGISPNYNDTLRLFSNAINTSELKIALHGISDFTASQLGKKMWEVHVPDNPFAYIQEYKPMSLKKIPDVNGDGIDDIILASRNYLTMCLNGNSSVQGDILWSFNTGYNNNNTGAVMFEDALQIRSDVDGDGVRDVVLGCGGGNEMVYTVSGKTGRLIWAYGDSVNYEDGDINGMRADMDFNNDGSPDVLISASGSSQGGRHAAICLNGVNGQEIFNKPQNGMFTFDITTLSGGGAICVDQNNGGPYFIRGFNKAGNEIWATPVADVIWNMKPVPDINSDGIQDFAAFCGGLNPRMIGLSGATGSILWQQTYPNYATFGTVSIIGDNNGNGYKDLIFSGKEGVFRLDTKDGSYVWQNQLDYSYVFGAQEIGDLNSDGRNEIIAGTKNSNFYILNGADGNIIRQEALGTPNDEAVERTIGIGSIDGNYSTEYILGTRDGRVICYSGGLAGPVPVELTSFSATEINNKVKIEWATASELNNRIYLLERNGNRIAEINGKGTTTAKSIYIFYDEIELTGRPVRYSLFQTDLDGTINKIAETELARDFTNYKFSLQQNYPNPVNLSAIIRFEIPGGGAEGNSHLQIIHLNVFDILGNNISAIINEPKPPGAYEIEFKTDKLSSGMYFIELQCGDNRAVKKMTVIK